MYVRGYLQGSENGRVVTIGFVQTSRKRRNVVGIDMIRNNRIVVGERNVGTEVRLQTGTYAAFSAPGQY